MHAFTHTHAHTHTHTHTLNCAACLSTTSFSFQTDLLEISNSTDNFVVIYIWASVFLRCTCFAIERVWSLKHVKFLSSSAAKRKSSAVIRKPYLNIPADGSRQRTSTSPSSFLKPNGCPVDSDSQLYGWPVLSEVHGLFDVFLYIFYMPLLFSGPPLPFKLFLEQVGEIILYLFHEACNCNEEFPPNSIYTSFRMLFIDLFVLLCLLLLLFCFVF